MITFERYRTFLEDLSDKGIRSKRVDQMGDPSGDMPKFVIKHDVEANLPLSLKLAQIEADCGHFATYYFQGDLLLRDGAAEIVKEISDLGHEAAYHYDVLDSCDGDFAAATQEFEQYHAALVAITAEPLRTVCPHGNPTKVRDGWRSNKDFFRNQDVREAYPDIRDIVVDFDSLMPNGIYISDAGYALRRIGNISGNDLSNDTAINDGKAIDWTDVAGLVAAGDSVVLSVHPHRLRESEMSVLLMRARLKFLRSGYGAAKRIPFVKAIASKLYSHARKF